MKALMIFFGYVKVVKDGKVSRKKMKTLKEIGLDENKIWAKLPIVINSNITDSMNNKELKMCEMKFTLLTQEAVFNKELDELHLLARESIKYKFDPLPLFNRRHIVFILKRLKKNSDCVLSDMERGWFGPGSVCLNPDKAYDFIDMASNPSYSLSYIAYMEMLEEFRKLLKRTAPSQHDITRVYSPRLSCERALGPLQRLASLRNALRKITEEEIHPEKIQRANQTLDNVSGLLDRCYEVLTSLHGPNYVADIDNILDFSLKLTSLGNNGKNEKTLAVPSVDIIRSSLMKTKNVSNLIDLTTVDLSLRKKENFEIQIKLPSLVMDCWIVEQLWMKSRFYQFLFPSQNVIGKLWAAFEDEEHVYEEIQSISEPSVRMLWSEIPVVVDSGILSILNDKEKALQESKFEIITSEVSYLKSLSVALSLFYNSPELKQTLTENELNSLFTNLLQVRDCSEGLLYELAGHFEEDILLRGISNVMRNQAMTNFSPYITYCSSQSKALVTLVKLEKTNPKFKAVCKNIESSKEVQGCTFQSFLSLPAQRVTRLPLLFQAVLGRLSPGSQEYANTKLVINVLQKLARACNESVEKIDRRQIIEEPKPKDVSKRKLVSVQFTGLFTV